MIYIDSDYRCHPDNPDGLYTPVETDLFDGKCDAYISGFRYVPAGASWTRSDGVTFHGEMISPWKPYAQLAAAQAQYETDLADRADLEASYNYLLTGVIENE